jgi:hypothetical protein
MKFQHHSQWLDAIAYRFLQLWHRTNKKPYHTYHAAKMAGRWLHGYIFFSKSQKLYMDGTI